jgi:hypothetical protein
VRPLPPPTAAHLDLAPKVLHSRLLDAGRTPSLGNAPLGGNGTTANKNRHRPR